MKMLEDHSSVFLKHLVYMEQLVDNKRKPAQHKENISSEKLD